MGKIKSNSKHPELIYFLQALLFLTVNVIILISTNLIGYLLLSVGFYKGGSFYSKKTMNLSSVLVFLGVVELFSPMIFQDEKIIFYLLGIISLCIELILVNCIVDGVEKIEAEENMELYSSDLKFVFRIMAIVQVLAFIASCINFASMMLFGILASLSSVALFIVFCRTYKKYLKGETSAD